jgi:hypothetical protein
MTTLVQLIALAALVALSAIPASAADPATPAAGQHYFELRTYLTAPGKLAALNTRFRDHTCALFQKHGMTLVGFWTPAPGQPGADNTLIYLLQHASKEAAEASWKAFRADPEWIKAKAASEVDGSLTEKVEGLGLLPTDYSPMK